MTEAAMGISAILTLGGICCLCALENPTEAGPFFPLLMGALAGGGLIVWAVLSIAINALFRMAGLA
jgi:hypothetical protein